MQKAKLTGEPADPWTASFFGQNYDIENKQDARLGLRELTNQLIHSVVLFPSATEAPPHRLDGVIVGSDHAVGTQVFFVPLASLVEAFRGVGLDETHGVADGKGREGQASNHCPAVMPSAPRHLRAADPTRQHPAATPSRSSPQP